MLRPFWCNDSTTTLRTLDDWLATHGDLSLPPTPTVACAQSRRRTSFSMMPHRRHRGAPRVIAALAGLVHDRESAADYERDGDNDRYQGRVHGTLHCEPSLKCTTANRRSRLRCGAQLMAHSASSSCLRLRPMFRLTCARWATCFRLPVTS